MTKEKALIILNECRLGGFARTLYTKEEYCTARDMAIKALEQEPILDKVLEDIKTEIEECWQMYEDRFDVGDCLDIIDKHINRK